MPNILDAVLPPRTPPESKRWMESLLRHPPPPEIALQLHQACSHVACTGASLPDMYAGMSMKKVSEVLQSKESHESFFRELDRLLVPVQELLERPDLAPIAEGVFRSVRHDLQMNCLDVGTIAAGGLERNHQLEYRTLCCLLSKVDEALLKIGKVVDVAVSASSSSSSSDEDSIPEKALLDRDDGRELAMQRMIAGNEKFRGRLLPGVMKEDEEKVDKIRARVFAEIEKLMEPLLNASKAGKDTAKHRPYVKYQEDDRALWIAVTKDSKSAQEFVRLGLREPTNRKNQTENNFKSTKKLDDLTEEYRQATDAALEKVQQHLRTLCQDLKPLLPHLVLAAQMSIVTRALVEHVDEARRRDWCIPELEPQPPSAHSGQPRMEVTGFWPYWKELRAPDTVCNDLVLDRVVLLTGSNMAGKSTVLRSIVAIALLGCCGLLVPAARAAIPFYDAFMLRNFSGDSPLEGLSSYALECVDIRAVMRDATGRSLVLLDEMGKGTEVLAATAMSGAMLQELARRGTPTVFATHLHDLVEVTRPLEEQQQLTFMCMEVKEVQGHGMGSSLARRKSTWRVINGICLESLALQVALDSGVSEEFINRAAQLYAQLRAINRQTGDVELSVLAGQRVAGIPGNEEAAALGVGSSDADEVPGDGSSREGAAKGAGGSNEVPEVPVKALEDAMKVLREAVATAKYQERTEQDAASTVPATGCDDDLASEGLAAEVEVHRVGPGQQPPALHCNKAAVYVIKYSSGWFYCGETDNIKGRLKYHRTDVVKSQHRGPGLELAYTLFGEGGKSRSRLVESRCITALQQQGFHLTSASDARNRNFGRAAPGNGAAIDKRAA